MEKKIDESAAFKKIRHLLAVRYAPPEWMIWEELTIRDRRMDMFVMSQWRSQAYRRIAFEIKTSYRDYVNELNQPTKRQAAIKVSHEFFFVAPRNIIPVDELPEGCGLIELNRTQLRVRKRPLWREKPEFPMSLFVRMLSHKIPERDIKTDELFKFMGIDLTLNDIKYMLEKERAGIEKAARRAGKQELREETEHDPTLETVKRHLGRYYQVEQLDEILTDYKMAFRPTDLKKLKASMLKNIKTMDKYLEIKGEKDGE